MQGAATTAMLDASARSGNAADGPRGRNRLRWLAFCSQNAGLLSDLFLVEGLK